MEDKWLNDIRIGDAYEVLKKMSDESIDMCVTSPPYWGLRDYGEEEQLGLEDTPEKYVERLVKIFHEVKRVLKPTGTLWLNIGDTYSGGGGSKGIPDDWDSISTNNREKYSSNKPSTNMRVPDKNLVGIPWRVAFALQEDGWYLRNDIIWNKPNPMPESVTDRCTTSHEHIFLLSKNKQYYYDHEAIKEPSKFADSDERADEGRIQYDEKKRKGKKGNGQESFVSISSSGRNKRDVWEITTKPFPGAHFAVFPPELPKTCIKAGCPPKVCSECGKPYERDVEHERIRRDELPEDDPRYRPNKYEGEYADINGKGDAGYSKNKFKGWKPTCDCDTEETEPGIVLDPFIGAGTTGMVAKNLNRKWVGIDISEEYREMALKRIKNGDKYIRKEERVKRKAKKARKQNKTLDKFSQGGEKQNA